MNAPSLGPLLDRLPAHLSERVHVRSSGAPKPDAPFVLYWMRTAVRGHENAALDVALETARALGTGVLVYHALSERYPFASDRHHRFILDGARDVEEEMRARGIPYAFHLERAGEGPRGPHRGPHLLTLAERAALVVTEDATWATLRRWTDRVADSLSTPLLLVDAACVYPSRRVPGKVADRAFKFRKAVEREWEVRIAAGWPEAAAPGALAADFDLPFEPLDFTDDEGGRLGDEVWNARAAAWIAACRIDHGVPPIPGTQGGSRAGYARWTAFRDGGLRGYARRRNDALDDGVSRMSPYLHYGHVSPLRIAREAAEVGGKGAEKYLDELLVWRELAHAFCHHHPDHDHVSVLPGWARETLAAHERDARPRLLTWEELARGESGDALWDACQRSLLVHGELHNNLRMTWGKEVLNWTPDAESALRMLLDLNHRYALDGRDPNSYGGILWCLGGLDRPFDPEKPIFGRVRPRSTAGHARRLDVEEYARRTARPAVQQPPRVAVIGAGVSGLACANTLADQGWSVVVLDKGRRPGGRANTRESREEEARRFDHGAQYFTARDPRFRRHVESWAGQGWVSEWRAEILRVAADGATELLPARRGDPRWVADPGMQELGEQLAAGLDVRCGARVERIEPAHASEVEEVGASAPERGWVLITTEGERIGPVEHVVVTAPPAQAAELFDSTGDAEAAAWAEEARSVSVAPTWAAMFEFEDVEAPAGIGADALLADGHAISWAARDSSKPGRAPGDRWVVHASPAHSRDHLEADREEMAERLLHDLRGLIERAGGRVGTPRWSEAHRWRYALAEEGPDGDCRLSTSGLAWAGDAFEAAGRARVEAAWLSGVAVAGRLLHRAAAGRPSPHPGQPDGARPRAAASAQGSLFD
jgi:photolyase PhrII